MCAAGLCILQGFFEVWGEGATWEELQASIEAFPEARKAPYYSPDITFKVNIDTWGFKFTAEEQRDAIQRLQFLPLEGKVDLKAAQVNFWLVCVDKLGNNGMPELPPRKYFLRQVALGDRWAASSRTERLNCVERSRWDGFGRKGWQ
jgi:tRNA (guanine10-N2)-methyltransferase